jgi:hypothetical protein
MGPVRQYCIDFRAVTKRSKTPQNMSFESNGLDLVRSLRKIPTRLCLANLYVNGNSSASFASTFVLYENGPKRPKTRDLSPMEWIGCVRGEIPMRLCLVLHRLLYCNKTVPNAPKHEFWVQWSGLGAFVAKNSDATLFSDLVR